MLVGWQHNVEVRVRQPLNVLIIKLLNKLLLPGAVHGILLVIHAQRDFLAVFATLIFLAGIIHQVFHIQLERVFCTDSFQLPPGLLVKLLYLCQLISPLRQMAVRVLLCIHYLHNEFDPWSNFARLNQIGSYFREVHEQEYLQDQYHGIHLKLVVAIRADLTKQLLEDGQELLCQVVNDAPIIFELVVVRTAQLAKHAQAYDRRCWVTLLLEALLNALLALGPALERLKLGDVVNYLLELACEHRALNLRDWYVEGIKNVWLDEVTVGCWDRNVVLVLRLHVVHLAIQRVQIHVFFIIASTANRLRIIPADINKSLEQTSSPQEYLSDLQLLSIEPLHFGDLRRIQNNWEQVLQAIVFLLSLKK